MTWECGCGAVNRDLNVMCRACQTLKEMGRVPDRDKPPTVSWLSVLVGVGLALICVLAAFTIANIRQVARVNAASSVMDHTWLAVTKSIEYAQDKGVYPTSLKMLREEGYMGAFPDKDIWGNEWVLSPVLTEGRTPRKGDNVYVYSRGPKGTGVYPQPFTHDTGEDGSVGYSSVDGEFHFQTHK